MIEGVIHHCTEMEVDRQYFDSHGQSAIAFGFCRLLGFLLLPRLKSIHSQKLYRPETGKADAYANLQLILSKPIELGFGASTVRSDDQVHHCAPPGDG
jgi:TnpA family transposase